jgi:hypothetical protein
MTVIERSCQHVQRKDSQNLSAFLHTLLLAGSLKTFPPVPLKAEGRYPASTRMAKVELRGRLIISKPQLITEVADR